VGRYCPTGNCAAQRRPLIEHWNGVAWTVVPGPDLGAGNSLLLQVAALGANNIWAAGFRQNSAGIYQTLVEHWNGTAWSIVPSPNSGAFNNRLESLAALSPNDVWVVGDACVDAVCSQQHLPTAHWNGSQWTSVPGLNGDGFLSIPAAVAGTSAEDVWLAGYYCNDYTCLALLEHWNGSAWSWVDIPYTAANTGFFAVLARTPDDVVVAGFACDLDAVGNSINMRNLVQRWDGTRWSVEQVANPGTDFNEIRGLAARNPNDLWAVGDWSSGPGTRTETEHFRGPRQP
jgi:hypothetical protein